MATICRFSSNYNMPGTKYLCILEKLSTFRQGSIASSIFDITDAMYDQFSYHVPSTQCRTDAPGDGHSISRTVVPRGTSHWLLQPCFPVKASQSPSASSISGVFDAVRTRGRSTRLASITEGAKVIKAYPSILKQVPRKQLL